MKEHASHNLTEETSSKGDGDRPEIESAGGENEENGVAVWVKDEGQRHAHFDCFSGAAGDMMLAACLDAHPHPEMLLERITECLRRGLPALANEFSVTQTRVWRGQGSIAARYVSVSSLYHHAPAPVPSHHDPNHHNHHHDHQHNQDEQHDHSHEHQHSQHENNHQEEVQHHSHEHSHGHDHSHQNINSHNHEHSHGHADQNGHGEGSGGPPLRNLPEIKAMLEEASVEWIPKQVKDWAVETFTALAEAEAMTHGASSIDAVHFHEVGAVDSIVDTVGTLLGLNELGVSTVSCSRLPMGEGTVWTDHGLLPVPAPATLRLLIGMPTCPGPPGLTGELVTPTAAALLRTLTKHNDTHKNMAGRAPALTPRGIGIGAGTKDFVKHPNIIRLIIGDNITTNDRVDTSNTNNTISSGQEVAPALLETNVTAIESPQKETTHPLAYKRAASSEEKEVSSSPTKKLKTRWKTDYLTHLEANLDDSTAEILAYTVELLLQKGAVDAWVVPIIMKKGRAAHTLHCLCRSMENQKDLLNELLLIIFRQTTTLGIRIHRGLERAALYRSIVPIQTPWTQEDSKATGLVDVKVSYLGVNSDNEEDTPEVVSIKAEFDHCRRVSQASGVPLKRVAEYATREVCDQIESSSRLLENL